MSAVTLQPSVAPASSGTAMAALPARRRPGRRRTLKRVLLSLFALAWIAGCIIVLTQVFSSVRTKCAGCPDCMGTAP